MARKMNQLSARSVETKREPGYYGDGGGLYLQVSKAGTKSWLFRFMLSGRAREMGLGPIHTITLAEARIRARQCRQQVLDGIDPIEARDAERAQRLLDGVQRMTFDQCAEAYIKAHRAGWKNAKHADQWANTLRTYASPVFGSLAVQAIDTGLVMSVVEPLWTEKTETASRLRGRIEAVLGWATVRGHRKGENPARWRGHLDKLLPQRAKVQAVKHHAALPYAQVADFMKALRQREGIAPKALEFVILTAARVSEAVNAKWGEIDLEARTWTVPANRMKSQREHRVPLSPAAVEVLAKLAEVRQSDYLFPGWSAKKPLTGAACLKLLDDMGHGQYTTHGFRSAFRDWAAEQTTIPREIAEAALAHVLKDKTEAAYQRGDLLDRRRALMEAWARYCDGDKAGTVVEITARKQAA